MITLMDRDTALKEAGKWANDGRWIICVGRVATAWIMWDYLGEPTPKEIVPDSIRYVLPGGLVTKLS